MQLGTFSIVARDKRSGDFGVASATAAPCVGAMLPYAMEGVGAIATQAWVNVNLGYIGLQVMRSGIPVKAALEALLSDDDGRERRQVIGIDELGVFGHTGDECTDAKGHIIGKDFAVAGNILSSKDVLDEMVLTFKASKGDLSDRLLRVLETGERTGRRFTGQDVRGRARGIPEAEAVPRPQGGPEHRSPQGVAPLALGVCPDAG